MTTKIDTSGLTLPDSSVIAARPSIYLPGDLLAGDYYRSPNWVQSASADARTQDNYRYTPLFLPTTITFDRIGLNITAAAVTAGKKGIVGIYKHTNGFIGTLQFDAGEIAIDAIALAVATIDQQLAAGWWWLACNISQDCSFTTVGNLTAFPSPGNAAASSGAKGFLDSAAYATTLPATPLVVAGDLSSQNPPWIFLRIKSVP